MPDTLVEAFSGWVSSPLRNWNRLRKLNTFDSRTSESRPASEEEPSDIIWAVRDVSFDVHQGEVVGIIGRNGAGKSTLLKILSRITEPTRGRAIVRGRVSSLLEVGTGFHPELTGRENIYMNGTILGMRKREIDLKFDEIVAFSEVERFLDTPIKRYSSGMKVRLAFAVAAHLEPEILVIDEVLAVGDAEFQKKCIGKMRDVAGSGRTILFVSHNLAALQRLCPRAILLSSGQLANDAPSGEIIAQYLSSSVAQTTHVDLTSPDILREGSGEARFTSAGVLSEDSVSTSTIPMGSSFKIRMSIAAKETVYNAIIGVAIYDQHGRRVAGLNSHDVSSWWTDLEKGSNQVVECVIRDPNLMPGRYLVGIVIKKDREIVDAVNQILSLDVASCDVYGTGRIPFGEATVFLNADWRTVDANVTV